MNALRGLLGVMSFAGLLLGHLAGGVAPDAGSVGAVSGQEGGIPVPAALARELAGKAAAALGAGEEVAMTADARRASREVARHVAAALSVANHRLVATPSPDSARLHISCAENLQSLVCTGEIRKGGERIVLLASGPRPPRQSEPGELLSALALTPVFAQRARILDVVQVGDRLLVLDPNGLKLFAGSKLGRTEIAALTFLHPPTWPRDLRGRLRVEGGRIEAFLPGFACRGTLDPFEIECLEDERSVWPLDVPGATLAAVRNAFTAPNVPDFFSAASLGEGQGAVQLLAGVDGRLHVFDGDGRRSETGFGDELAALTSACGSGRQVVIALPSAREEGRDAVCACEMVNGELVTLTAPTRLPGLLTALWPADGPRVTAVVFNAESERYEAFFLALVCAR